MISLWFRSGSINFQVNKHIDANQSMPSMSTFVLGLQSFYSFSRACTMDPDYLVVHALPKLLNTLGVNKALIVTGRSKVSMVLATCMLL